MFLSLLFYEIIPFSERNDNILKENSNAVTYEVSGSIGQYYDGKCHQTDPSHIIDSAERKTDWCSNYNKTKDDIPWYDVSIKGKSMSLTGYAIRSGCCYYGCCCDDGKYIQSCCCWLYSWSLQGSNDNKTWVDLHHVEKDDKFYDCANRVFEIKKTEPYKYVRLTQTEPWPGCIFCMCINKIELYGQAVDESLASFDSEDDSVSIIGKVSKGNEY